MLETYQAYADYQVMATLTRELIQECCAGAVRRPRRAAPRRHRGRPVGGVAAGAALHGWCPRRWASESPRRRRWRRCGPSPSATTSASTPPGCPARWSRSSSRRWCSDTLQAPTFVVDYPLDTSPLTRAHRSEPGLAEKWDLYIGGIERATAYSELVDPVAQRERFTAQAALAAAGDPEAMALDEDFLEALEYGMPPDRRHGDGHGPADDDAHRSRHPRDDPVPAGPAHYPRSDEQSESRSFTHRAQCARGIAEWRASRGAMASSSLPGGNSVRLPGRCDK